MSSTILTKVNTVRPKNFNEQIGWMQGTGDFDFLHRFVCLCHKKADKTFDSKTCCITAFTKNGYYIYKGYSKHIVRTTQTDKKVYYKIS